MKAQIVLIKVCLNHDSLKKVGATKGGEFFFFYILSKICWTKLSRYNIEFARYCNADMIRFTAIAAQVSDVTPEPLALIRSFTSS